MKIVIVDDHHKVLSAWAELRRQSQIPPHLISFDFHTDTSRPFRRKIMNDFKQKMSDYTQEEFNDLQQDLLRKINFNSPETIKVAISNLSHDEHIVTAIKSDIISAAFILAQSARNTDLKTYQEHKIICREVREVVHEDKGRLDYDCVLESEFLQTTFSEFNKILFKNNDEEILERPFILDIDLDFFNTFKSVDPNDSSYFKILAKKASLVTIATEPEYVLKCARDKDLTSSYLLEKVIKLIDSKL